MLESSISVIVQHYSRSSPNAAHPKLLLLRLLRSLKFSNVDRISTDLTSLRTVEENLREALILLGDVREKV